MEELLRHIELQVPLTAQDRELLTTYLRQRTYRKKEYIVRSGGVCRSHTFILSGTARTYLLDGEGHEHIIAFGLDGWWVGDLESLLNQTPAKFDVQCLAPTTVVQLPYEHLEELYRRVPALERFFRLIIQRAYVSAQNRVVRNLSYTARERYEWFVEHYPAVVARVPQYMVASYLGVSKEFLSTIRRQITEDAGE